MSLHVHVKFFAIFREFTKIKSESKEIAEGTTVEMLWQDYANMHPRIGKLRAAYAVNQHLAKPDQMLRDGDEVGFLPPVSGGAVKQKPRRAKGTKSQTMRGPRVSRRSSVKDAFITRKAIDLNALYRAVSFPGAGAIILFSGIVRDNAQGKAVDHLEYEAYPEMAQTSMVEIISEIKDRWADARVAMAHRIGRLKIGEASLVIAVAAPHRPEAYAASRYAIERVKASVPVWKKEFWTDGEHWVEGPIAGELLPEKADKIVEQAERAATQSNQRPKNPSP